MSSLVALWDASLLLCSAALLALAALLLARVIAGNRAQRRKQERSALVAAMLSGEHLTRPRGRRQTELAAQITIELAELVRGSERDAFLASAEDLGVPGALRRRMRSHSAQVRLTAAEALALFPGETGREVTRALADRNAHVRLGAALALAQAHAAPPAAELVRDLGLGTRERSLLVLSLMRDLVAADPAGVEAMLNDPAVPDAAKLAASEALAESGLADHAPLVAWMTEAARHDTTLQPRIYRALGRIGHPNCGPAILAGLESQVWQVRTAAAEAAGKVGVTDAADRLAELLDDAQWWVRFRAGEALARLGKRGRLALLTARQSGPPLARVAARETLAEQGV